MASNPIDDNSPGPDPAGDPSPPADDPEPAAAPSAEQERDEYKALAQRIQADFENYKKRILKQQTEHLARAGEDLVTKLLPVLDTADLALAHDENESLGQVVGALRDVLAKEGLERIDPAGQAFDPTEHDAVMHEAGEGEPTVSEVLRAGYRWRGRVLRAAMVKVTG
ncbi:MAG TPA: nucleotide exchange factor GrpE [Acidimicrobiales bacterium]|nr:nucleotide exchange factor GrpE [Acidimicrobiales bacterium]